VVFNGVPDYLNGGFPILVYKVEVQIEGVRTGQEILVNPLTNTALVTGLKNGTSYTFVVIATNQIGDSDPSLPSNSVTPVAVQTGITVPDAPTQVTASAGNASAVVSWKLPVSNGGSAITGFLVVPTANGIPSARGSVVPAPATSATIPGLINGATYTFTVQAINVMGASGLSAPSNAVMPAAAAQSTGVPSLPTGVSATAGVASATVTWTPPVNAGNSAISNYVVVAMSGGALTGNSVNVPAPATSVTINGLSAGTTYTFVVHAFNGTGDSGASIPSNAITPSAAAPPPASAPGVPTGVTAVAGNSSATVAWNAPASNGGSPIQSYNVVALSGGSPSGVSVTVTAPATAVQITKLTNGTAYTFVVHAINAAGDSGASAPSNTVTPGAPVPAPSGSANVGVTLTGPATVSAGTNAIFTITVTNSGAGTVPSVVLEDIFNLASGTLLSHVTSQGTCTDGTAVLDCKLGSLAAGASATIGFTLTVNTRITNKATVEALDSTGQRIPSSSPANSTASLITAVSASVSVAAAADLQISGTSTGTGAETTLVWLVSNTTNQIANAVRFTDQLPSALQLVSTMASAGVNCAAPASGSSGGLVTCSYHSLPGGQNMMVTITVTAAPSATPIATTASVDFNGTDSNPANNSFTLSVAAPLPPSPPPPATGGATGGGGAGGGGGVVVPGLNGGGGAGGHGGACVQPVLGGRGGAARGAGEIGGFLPGRCGGPGA
jgi:titin